MNKKPINQPLYPNRPPIVPNAAPVVPGAPRDLGENGRLKVLEDRLVPKNTKRIAKEIPDFDALLDSDYVYISNDDSELRKIRAVKLTSAVEGLNYNAIIDATDKIEGIDPIGQTFTIPAEYFNRVPIYLEQVLLYLRVIYTDAETGDRYTAAWATTAQVTDARLKRDDPEPEVEIAKLAKLNADTMNEYLAELDEIEVRILAGIDILENLNENLIAEIARAKAAEKDLDDKIDQEIADRIQDVDDEEARAIDAETALDEKIDQEIQDRIDDVDAEEARAIEAEGVLQDNIEAEEQRAGDEEARIEAKLDQEIQDRADDVDAEELRATTAEGVLDDKIDQEIIDRAADVDTEETRAKGVEANLQEQLNTRATQQDILDLFNTSGNEIVDETMELTEADNISNNTLELNIGTNSQIVNNKLVLE